MKFLLAAALCLGFSSYGGIPEDVAEFVRQEQCFNCKLPQGKLPSGQPVIVGLPALAEERREPFKVFYWNLPRHQVREDNLFISRFIDKELLQFAMHNPTGNFADGETLIRSFVPETNPTQMKIARDSLGREPDGFYEAVQIQGRDSAVGWNPSNPGGKKWIFKFGGDFERPDGSTIRLLGPTTIERAVRTSDIVEDILREEGTGGIAGMLPERYGTWIGGYGVILREMRNVGLQLPPGTGFGVPLHSLLSEEMYTLVAVTSQYPFKIEGNNSVTTWIAAELLPKLAKFVAQVQLVHGIMPELHTQNIKVIFEMDPQTHTPTGFIAGFVFTDMTDVAIDVGIRGFSHLPTYLKELHQMRSPNIMHFKVMGESEVSDPRVNLMSFLSQSVGSAFLLSLPKNPQLFQSMKAADFEDYEAKVYQIFVLAYFDSVGRWLEALGHTPSNFLDAFKTALQKGVVVEDPSPNTARIGQGNQPKSIADLRGQLRPSKGLSTLYLFSQLAGNLGTEMAQAATMEILRKNKGGGGRPQQDLRRDFMAMLEAKQVGFYHFSFSSDVDKWINSPQIRFAEIPGVGIVAYEQMRQGRLLYPGMHAVGFPPSQREVLTQCSEAVLAAGDIVWSNRHVPQMKAAAQLYDRLLGVGLLRD